MDLASERMSIDGYLYVSHVICTIYSLWYGLQYCAVVLILNTEYYQKPILVGIDVVNPYGEQICTICRKRYWQSNMNWLNGIRSDDEFRVNKIRNAKF